MGAISEPSIINSTDENDESSVLVDADGGDDYDVQNKSDHQSLSSHTNRINLINILLRPSVWTALVAIIAYWDDTALHGAFVYDDAGSVRQNVVVNGKVPWTEVFIRDYWGQLMSTPQSHKSYRPITTLSFKLNWWIASHWLHLSKESTNFTYGFHIVNIVLHALATVLVTEAAMLVLQTECTDYCSYQESKEQIPDRRKKATILEAAFITGALFAVHPVHAEAVSNITSRSELLMSIFFLLAFLSYASCVPRTIHDIQSFNLVNFVGVYILPFIFMSLSLFAKEQGATALITAVAYDGIQNYGSVQHYFASLSLKSSTSSMRTALARSFLRRLIVLACQTLMLCGLRYWLNGESSPDFIFDQNPAAFSENRFTRAFSVSWVYCLYVRDAIVPIFIGPDWSGLSIPLIESWNDWRVPIILSLWLSVSFIVFMLVSGSPRLNNYQSYRLRTQSLIAFFAFIVSPFLLSSNILVVVGLMKADRVIYLPLMGYCLLQAIVYRELSLCTGEAFHQTTRSRAFAKPQIRIFRLIGYIALLLQLYIFSVKVHERNFAWSSSLHLWMSAYKINPRSRHTIYNCGYELSLKHRYDEAERVLREIGSPYVEGPSNTFVYVMVLFNLNRCDEAKQYLHDAFHVLNQKRQSGGVRYTDGTLNRLESNLLVAQAMCLQHDNMIEAGRVMYQAVEKDRTNEYAIQQATAMAQRVEQFRLLQDLQRNPKPSH
jgi:protein O-mannosyl-transferase